MRRLFQTAVTSSSRLRKFFAYFEHVPKVAEYVLDELPSHFEGIQFDPGWRTVYHSSIHDFYSTLFCLNRMLLLPRGVLRILLTQCKGSCVRHG